MGRGIQHGVMQLVPEVPKVELKKIGSVVAIVDTSVVDLHLSVNSARNLLSDAFLRGECTKVAQSDVYSRVFYEYAFKPCQVSVKFDNSDEEYTVTIVPVVSDTYARNSLGVAGLAQLPFGLQFTDCVRPTNRLPSQWLIE